MSSLYGVGGPVDCRKVDLWASDPDSDTSSDGSRDEMQSCRTPREQPSAAAVSYEDPIPAQKDAREIILRAFQEVVTSPEYLKDQVGYVERLIAEASNNPDYEFIFPEFSVLNMLREKHGL